MRILVVATQIQLPGTHGGSTHVGELIESLRTHGPTMALVRRGSRGKHLVGISLGTGYPAGIKHIFSWMYLPAAWLAARNQRLLLCGGARRFCYPNTAVKPPTLKLRESAWLHSKEAPPCVQETG